MGRGVTRIQKEEKEALGEETEKSCIEQAGSTDNSTQNWEYGKKARKRKKG